MWCWIFALSLLVQPIASSSLVSWSLSEFLDGFGGAQVLLIQMHTKEDFVSPHPLQLFGGQAVVKSIPSPLLALMGLSKYELPPSARPVANRGTNRLAAIVAYVPEKEDRNALSRLYAVAEGSAAGNAIRGMVGGNSVGSVVSHVAGVNPPIPTVAHVVSDNISPMDLWRETKVEMMADVYGALSIFCIEKTSLVATEVAVNKPMEATAPLTPSGLLALMEIRDSRTHYGLVVQPRECEIPWVQEAKETVANIQIRGNNMSVYCPYYTKSGDRELGIHFQYELEGIRKTGYNVLWYEAVALSALTCSNFMDDSSGGGLGMTQYLVPMGLEVWIGLALTGRAIILLHFKLRYKSLDKVKFCLELISSLWEQDGVRIASTPPFLRAVGIIWILQAMILLDGYKSILTTQMSSPVSPRLPWTESLLAASGFAFLVHMNTVGERRLELAIQKLIVSERNHNFRTNSIWSVTRQSNEDVRRYKECRYFRGKKVEEKLRLYDLLRLSRFNCSGAKEWLANISSVAEKLMVTDLKESLFSDLFEIQDNTFLVEHGQAVEILSQCNGSALLLSKEEAKDYRTLVTGTRSHVRRIPYELTSDPWLDLGYKDGIASNVYFTAVEEGGLGLMTRRLRMVLENGLWGRWIRSDGLLATGTFTVGTGAIMPDVIVMDVSTSSIFLLWLIPLGGALFIFLTWDQRRSHGIILQGLMPESQVQRYAIKQVSSKVQTLSKSVLENSNPPVDENEIKTTLV